MRLEALVAAHGAATWRVLRRLGLGPADADDALQEVLCVVARRSDDLELGRERAFFIGVARRVVSTRRRSARRRPEVLIEHTLFEQTVEDATSANPEDQRALREAVEQLDRILDRMPDPVREVFVFSAIENMTSPEIAELLTLPIGTVSTRLRRGRSIFSEAVAALNEPASERER